MAVRGRIFIGDPSAAAAGVAPGQRLSTALGLAPGLLVRERDPGREQVALAHLACWAGRFTPQVSLVPPATLVLEIDGCRRLFGGAGALIDAALASCRELGYAPRWAAAPTPLGATWLAWSAGAALHDDPAGFAAALAALPCTIPAWPAETTARIQSFGARRLGDLRRLPAAGLRRRLGSAVVDDLQRAWGELPDPRRSFVFPEQFAQDLELPARVEQAAALAFAGQRLFAALAGWLHCRQLATRSCRLLLRHDDGSRSALTLGLVAASADEHRLGRLLREHLARLPLPAPVVALRLSAEELVANPGSNGRLFDQAAAGEGVFACLERLRGRLGAEAVHVLGRHADYRPECATATLEPGAGAVPGAGPDLPRPLWLLPEPLALAERDGRPRWHGPLQFLTRPERLESGWWDAGEPAAPGDVRRDYFVARNDAGQWAWIFRDARGWFLHGLFA